MNANPGTYPKERDNTSPVGKSRQRILVVGPTPPPFAGPELAMQAILESPLSQWHEIKHINTTARSSNAQKGRLSIGLAPKFLWWVARYAWTVIRFRPSVVYAFVTATPLGWVGRDIWNIWIARAFGARVVIHMRAGHFQHRLKSAPKIIRWAISLSCRQCTWCLAQSKSLTSQFAELCDPQRRGVVPNMIPVERYKATPSRTTESPTVLFLGHLTTAKGYCDLLRCIEKVVKRHPGVTFEFAGEKKTHETNVFHNQLTGKPLPEDDPETVRRNTIDGKLDKNYKYLGVLDEEGKIAALKRCTALVQPSYSEGFSMAILEALSIGRPVVCTRVGAMPDFLESETNGVLFEPGDLDSLTEGIVRALQDQQWQQRVGRENAALARDNFSPDVVARTLEAYLTTG